MASHKALGLWLFKLLFTPFLLSHHIQTHHGKERHDRWEHLLASVNRLARPRTNTDFIHDLARAYGSALVFSFPMLMTMELWWLGFSISGIRLLIFVLLGVVLVAGLSFYEGISDTFGGRDDLLDTMAAYFVGFTTSALMLYLFGVIRPGMHIDEVFGKIALQAVPASIGAIFGEAVLGISGGSKTSKRATGYKGQLFLTVAGAVFLGMSVSPTEEMRLIAFQMDHWFSLALALFTLLLTHIFIYASNRGQEELTDASFFDPALFLRFSVVSYSVVLLVSAYILWTFGSLDGMGPLYVIKTTIVLAFPAALGASASKLLI